MQHGECSTHPVTRPYVQFRTKIYGESGSGRTCADRIKDEVVDHVVRPDNQTAQHHAHPRTNNRGADIPLHATFLVLPERVYQNPGDEKVRNRGRRVVHRNEPLDIPVMKRKQSLQERGG